MLQPGQRLGHYEIVKKLGEGGMGVVFQARDLNLHRLVAIKILPAEYVRDSERKKRFFQEARSASALNHPGIVTIYEIAAQDGIDYMAMELIEGVTLGDLMSRGALSLKDTLTYAVQAANALARAHGHGIIHRDIKPSNLMVTRDGLVKVLDFGVAKLMGSIEPGEEFDETVTVPVRDAVATRAGQIVGTAAYMSPEQAQGKPLDARSDIFSFGVVLYEMATGVRPFRASSSSSAISAVINDEPAVPAELRRDLPHDLERIILRCLRKDPARRYQVMADLAVELEDVRTQSGTRVAGAPRHEARSMRWMLAGALVAAAAATAFVWWPTSHVDAPTVSASMTPLTTFANDERWPSLSPDGNQVAFTWSGENGDNEDLYVVPVGVGTPLRLTSDPSPDRSAAWSPDGSQIAFVRVAGRERTLYVMPPIPNAERRIATVLAPLIEVGALVRVSWLPDGRRLVLTAGDQTGEMLGIVTISLSGEMTRLIWSPRSEGSYRLPAVSPDGRSLAYAMCRATFACDLYVAPMDANLRIVGEPRRLTPTSAIATGLAWSADGQAVIYGWQAEYQSYLWRVRLDGSAPERIDLAGELASHPSVSARGHLLAYQRSTNDRDVWRFTASGARGPIASSTRYDSFPSYSPDGRRIAFESNRLGRLQVWTANADGSNARPLTEPDSGGQGSPRWSRDGLWIAYDEQLPEGPQGVFVVPSDGGTGRKVAVGSIPAWSADGRLYFDRSGAIWRVSTNGGGEQQIVSSGTGAVESSDGATLFYQKSTVPGILFARATAGGPERQVLALGSGRSQFDVVQDGIYFAAIPAGEPQVREIRFFEFATSQTRTLFSINAPSGSGLSVSPRRDAFLYSFTTLHRGDDLMLLRNFR